MDDKLQQCISSKNSEQFRIELEKRIINLPSIKDVTAHNKEVNILLDYYHHGCNLLPRYYQEKYLKALEGSRITGSKKAFSFNIQNKMRPAHEIIVHKKNQEEKEFEINWTICNKKNEKIVYQSNGKSISINKLENCEILIPDEVPTLSLNSLSNCIFIAQNVTGSARITNCYQCKFVLSVKQLRIHETKETDFYISVIGNPIIEGCRKLRFASLKGDESGPWNNVKDFDCPTQEESSPNWCMIPEEQRKKPEFKNLS